MKLPGIVTNITAFGAFVDIGVHQDGLVHISEISDGYVKKPFGSRESPSEGDGLRCSKWTCKGNGYPYRSRAKVRKRGSMNLRRVNHISPGQT